LAVAGQGGRYLVALGSNVRHPRHGSPGNVLHAALAELARTPGLTVEAISPTFATAPVGRARRRYANAAAVIASALEPPAVLARLQGIEQRFARVRRGASWGPRTLDLDLVLWSGGPWVSPGLTIPHPAFRTRGFVLAPARAVAPRWRDPLSGLTVNHLAARLTRPHPTRNPPSGTGP
jgi:2-amino-4-hydroxy-6-hydroxymethyldihydropteridine diphosphokinase